eukprot:TRINITY_DN2497_c0_g1_i1.p2 TRINITY_DN2497_c0_g1~~TRINITY_DN2497_c0_g1_i1.p2  ORF type:complete len:220 (-),score=54.01 TRINITY_DN2497_c0_g1_i1:66-647(-)
MARFSTPVAILAAALALTLRQAFAAPDKVTAMKARMDLARNRVAQLEAANAEKIAAVEASASAYASPVVATQPSAGTSLAVKVPTAPTHLATVPSAEPFRAAISRGEFYAGEHAFDDELLGRADKAEAAIKQQQHPITSLRRSTVLASEKTESRASRAARYFKEHGMETMSRMLDLEHEREALPRRLRAVPAN